eukprot:3649216-Rhodomonas_salina.3
MPKAVKKKPVASKPKEWTGARKVPEPSQPTPERETKAKDHRFQASCANNVVACAGHRRARNRCDTTLSDTRVDPRRDCAGQA